MKSRITAIDFCTSKIVTIVAETSADTRCNILGVGLTPYAGYAADGWNEPEKLREQIAASIGDAEKSLRGQHTQSVYVGVPAAFTSIYASDATVQLKGAQAHVTDGDIAEVVAAAEEKIRSQVKDGYILHSSPAWYRVDSDGKKTLNVLGQKGHELSVLISVAVADKYFVEDVTHHLNDLGYQIAGMFPTVVGETLLNIPAEERDRRAVLIDIGYLTTDVMIAEGDALIYLKSIEMGGCDLTLDLTMGLNIQMEEAENKIKRQFVYGVDTGDKYEVGGTGGQPVRTFSRQEVANILMPRVEELSEEIRKAIDESGVNLGKNCAIYLTGGGLSFNRGGRDVLAGKLGRPVREIPKQTNSLTSHIYAASLGLMDLICEMISTQNQRAVTGAGRLKQFFSRLLRG